MSKGSEHIKKWRKRTKARIVSAFNNKCCICKAIGYPEIYDLHHVDPKEKEYTISKLMSRIRGWKTIVAELRKCVMLCANCHRLVHANHKKVPQDAVRFDESFAEYKIPIDYGRCQNPNCNAKLAKRTQCCSPECAKFIRRKTEWPTKEELDKLLKVNSYCAVGRMFGVSDNAIRKWQKYYSRVA